MTKEEFLFPKKESLIDIENSYKIIGQAVKNILNTLEQPQTIGGEIFTMLGQIQKEEFDKLLKISQRGHLSPGILDIEEVSEEEKNMIVALFETESFDAFRQKLNQPEAKLSDLLPKVKNALEKFYNNKLKYWLEKRK